MMTMNVSAASTEQDGLEVSLTTDKSEYSQDDPITATLSVTNTNDAAVSNVSLENMIPEGYSLAEGSEAEKQVESLDAGETVTMSVTYIADSSDGGDDTGDAESADSAGLLEQSYDPPSRSCVRGGLVGALFTGYWSYAVFPEQEFYLDGDRLSSGGTGTESSHAAVHFFPGGVVVSFGSPDAGSDASPPSDHVLRSRSLHDGRNGKRAGRRLCESLSLLAPDL